MVLIVSVIRRLARLSPRRPPMEISFCGIVRWERIQLEFRFKINFCLN